MSAKRVLILSFLFLTFLSEKSVQAQATEPFLGQISMVAFNFAPRGWALCNGQLLSIQQNPALFSLLGTTYGGDGVSTFALPNLQGRVPVHAGNGPGLTPRVQGEVWGTESVTILQSQMPIHTHTATATANTTANINVSNQPGTTSDPSGAYLAHTGTFDREYGTTANATMNSAAVSASTTTSVAVGAAGGSQPVSTSPPSLGVYFIIALEGVYPSRP